MTMNAAELLLENGSPQRIALACGDEQLTYHALRDATARAASAWRARGVAPGDRVAIKLPDGSAWVSAFLGTIWSGGVAVAVNPRIPAEDWQVILSEKPFRFILAETRAETPAAFRDRVVLVDEWLREVKTAPPMAAEPVNQDAPAFWTHSSGSSGRPKAVVHAHRFALGVERVAAELLAVGAHDRLFASSKLFFAYSLGNSLLAGLKLGATVIVDAQWPTAANVAATIAAQRPTVFFSVPSLYRNLLKEGHARQLARQGIKACVSAGEALSAGLREEWRKQTGVSIVNGYGASETLSLVLINASDGEEFSPAPGVNICGMNGRDHGIPTRVRISAPTLALGYWNRPDAESENFIDGDFCPADLFEPAGANAWRFVGREDSLVKIRGRWVNLVELEERLAVACPSIVEAAAASVPDADGVPAVAFFYVLKLGTTSDATNALQAYAQTLPHYQRPRWLRAVPSLPRTATGKLLRRKLQDLHPLHAAEESG